MDEERLYRFEAGLDPQNLKESAIPATILGYGEISAIFQITGDDRYVYKRMPLFATRQAAAAYDRMYHEYSRMLTRAGLRLPAHHTRITSVPGRPVSLYIAQEKLPEERLCHRLIHSLDSTAALTLIEQVVSEINKIWLFNQSATPDLELAIDGQLSNWACLSSVSGSELHYIDTSTPLFRKNGTEQQDPELMLRSAPGFLRWLIRLFFLKDVMSRYYNPRLVFTDLAANLYKEQKPGLVPGAIDIINRSLPDGYRPLTVEHVNAYYREDKRIWILFLAFRKADRWIKTRLMRQRYEFILPGQINR